MVRFDGIDRDGMPSNKDNCDGDGLGKIDVGDGDLVSGDFLERPSLGIKIEGETVGDGDGGIVTGEFLDLWIKIEDESCCGDEINTFSSSDDDDDSKCIKRKPGSSGGGSEEMSDCISHKSSSSSEEVPLPSDRFPSSGTRARIFLVRAEVEFYEQNKKAHAKPHQQN